VALLIDLHDPVVELRPGGLEIALGLSELRLGGFGCGLRLAELRLGVVVVFYRRFEQIVEIVDARLKCLGFVLGRGDRSGLSPRDIATKQGGYREDENDGNET
jgi:hypothetical protein